MLLTIHSLLIKYLLLLEVKFYIIIFYYNFFYFIEELDFDKYDAV